MKRLSINIDHIATIRQARNTKYPEVVYAAGICEISGANGITIHLREDRRHIQDRDVHLLRQVVTTKLNLEMASTEEIGKIALDIKPDMITLVPEKRQELTTEGGLDIIKYKADLKEYIKPFKDKGILVSLFIEPSFEQLHASKEVNADFVEIHTGKFCGTDSEIIRNEELIKITNTSKKAMELGLKVAGGHGINYHNIEPLLRIPEIEEFSIGHGIIAHAIFVGLGNAVKEMINIFNRVVI